MTILRELAPPSTLFGLVQEHLQAFFRHARELYDGPLPKYVKEEFRKYLECGEFSRGFVHVQCPVCHEDKAAAFCFSGALGLIQFRRCRGSTSRRPGMAAAVL